ncbi:hypothetical protein [Brachyspira sp. G79]|uniref:hypothetical protein n=1 Tax=Brachyspira sp. G79 TaxID=1358104 RepID=UPI000BBC294E|nr:hypothetical protein [Brachyspira sp. G79]PCG20251.1 hypothetical protein KQ44_09660 [Brachyspira sp. G79]
MLKDKDEYHSFKDIIITFPDFIIAYYEYISNRLYFKYEQALKSTIDLSKYYREAKDEEIKNLFLGENSLFFSNNSESIIKNTSIYSKKRIFSIIKNLDILKEVDINIIKKQAKLFKITIEFNDNNQIILPENDKELLNKYIKFFNGDLFKHPFFDKFFESNSKKEII